MTRLLVPAVVTVAVIALGFTSSAQQPVKGKGSKGLPRGEAAVGSPAAPEPATAPAPGGPPEFRVRLPDDSTLKLTLLDPSITVHTKYGKLTIPAADVRRIDFGFHYPDGAEVKIEAAATDLGSPDFKAREEATVALQGYEELAIPALKKAARSADPEVVRRAETVLKKLREKLPAEKFDIRDYDLVETPEFTARGKVELNELKVRNAFFGEKSLPVAQIRDFRAVGRSAQAVITLDAATVGRANEARWHDTGIDVLTSTALDITATGEIDLQPQQPGQMVVGPTGVVIGGVDRGPGGGPAGAVGGFGGRGGPGMASTRSRAGQLIGRVGEAGDTFAVGAAYRGNPPAAGRLYLRIQASPLGTDPTGSYRVKVTTGG